MKLVVAFALLAGLVCGTAAQTASGKLSVPVPYLQRDQQFQPVMAAGATGVYVLHKGVLARFAAATLELQGTADLVPPEPPVTTPLPPESRLNPSLRRLLPAAMALHGADLVALIGDQFVCVDPVTLKLKVSKSLAAGARADRAPAGTLQRSGAGDAVHRRYRVYPSFPAIPRAHGDRHRGGQSRRRGARRETAAAGAGSPHRNLAPAHRRPRVQRASAHCCSSRRAVRSPRRTASTCCAAARWRNSTRARWRRSTSPRSTAPSPPRRPRPTPADIQDAAINRAARLLPAAMVVQGGDLLIVQGDDFFQVNPATLAVTRHVVLTQASGDARVTRTIALISLGAPQLQSAKNGVLVTRGKECFLREYRRWRLPCPAAAGGVDARAAVA